LNLNKIFDWTAIRICATAKVICGLIFLGGLLTPGFADQVQDIKLCKNKTCSNPVSIKPEFALQIVNSIIAEGKENSSIKFCEYSQKERACKSDHVGIWSFSTLPPFIPWYVKIHSLNYSKTEDGKFFYSAKATQVGISVLCSRFDATFLLKESQVVLDATQYCNWMAVGNVMSSLKVQVKEIYPLEKKLLVEFKVAVLGTGVGKVSELVELSFEGFDWVTAAQLIKEQPPILFANQDLKADIESNALQIVGTNPNNSAIKDDALKEATLKEAAIKEAALKEAALKEAALKEAALKEAALKEAALKEAALKEEALRKNLKPIPTLSVVSQTQPNKDTSLATSPKIDASRMKLTALIIGNGGYKSGYLKNPKNDADEISKKLIKFNFDVTTVYDSSREKLIQALDSYSRKSRDSDVSIFFYAGHGVQVNGMNYLIPVDMDIASISQVTLRGIPLNNVIEEFMPSKTKLIFLDACRDNPMLAMNTRGINRGLAPVNVPSGTLIAFSTKDGSVAQDGDDKNSPFTAALLKHLDAPDDISVVLRKVRTEVKRITGGSQEPWDYGSLEGGSLVLSKIGFNN